MPIDVVLDAISLEDTQSVAWDVLAPNGTLVLVLDATGDRSRCPNKKIVNDIYGSVHQLFVDTRAYTRFRLAKPC